MIDKSLLNLLGENKKYIPYTVACQILGMLAGIGTTACMCYMIWLLYLGSVMNEFFTPLFIAIFLICVRYVASRMTGEFRDRLGREVKKDLRKAILDKTLTLGVRSFDGIGMAGLTQISVEGVEQLDLYYSSYIPQFFFAMTEPVLLFIICFPLDFKVALTLLCCVPLIPLSIVAVSKYAKKIFAKYWDKYISMGDKFLDSVQGLKELKIFRADERQHKKMNENAEEFRKITMKVLVMQLFSTTIMDLVAYGGAGVGIAITLFDVVNNGLSPFKGLFLILVAVEFFLPLRVFGSAFHVAMNGVSAGKKIIALFNMPEPVWGDKELSSCEIKLNNVSFSYDSEREILKNVSMIFPEKGMSGIVGESGCGKSTVVNLIIGAYLPKEGEITVGEAPLKNLSRESYYGRLALVSYDTHIFNESVRENFRMRKADISDEEIYEALKKVNMYDFIDGCGGLDKEINEDATNISGGQRQRLALAAALAADKDIYIFDEATSNIDAESEEIIMRNIRDLAKEKSVILISHRLENVVPAGNIYYMENGKVAESGTHEALMKRNGGYAALYTAQKILENGGLA